MKQIASPGLTTTSKYLSPPPQPSYHFQIHRLKAFLTHTLNLSCPNKHSLFIFHIISPCLHSMQRPGALPRFSSAFLHTSKPKQACKISFTPSSSLQLLCTHSIETTITDPPSLGSLLTAAIRIFLSGFLLLLLLLLSRFSHVRLFATPETAAHQALPSLGFSRQEHWSGYV